MPKIGPTILLALLTTAVPAADVVVTYDPRTLYYPFRTFMWDERSCEAMAPGVREQIHRVISDGLAAKTLREVPQRADRP